MTDFKMNEKVAFQDQIPQNNCFGCGPENKNGLRIKSYWLKADESVCRFMPSAHHSAGPAKYLNGGITSTIIDCHCICTAMAKAYEEAGREIGAGEKIWFVTGRLEVNFRKPVVIDKEVLVIARIVEVKEKKITLQCTLSSEGVVCTQANVVALRVPNEWAE